MAPTRVDISVDGDDLLRRNADQTKAKRFAAVDQRFFDGVQGEAVEARKVAAAAAGVDADGRPLNDKAKDLQRVDDEPGANRRNSLLYVCMGFAEHPDQAVWQPWLSRIAARGFKNYTFVYLQLEPQPSSYRPKEVLFKNYHSDMAAFWLANHFDRVKNEAASGANTYVPARTVDIPTWYSLWNMGYAKKIWTVFTPEGHPVVSEIPFGTFTTKGYVDPKAATLTYTTLQPFASVLPQDQRRAMRLGVFNYKATGASLLQTLKTVTGLPLNKFKHVVFDVHPIYRDHQTASDTLGSPGVLHKKAAINLLPFLEEVGSHLRNAGYRMDNGLNLGSSASPQWNGYVNPFEFQGVAMGTDERQNIISEGLANGFYNAWRPEFYYPFIPTVLPARGLDPLVDYRASLSNPLTATAVIPPVVGLNDFLNGLGKPEWRGLKTAFLMDAGINDYGGTYQYPRSYKYVSNPHLTTAKAKELRYTYPAFNPLLRLYIVLDALFGYGIL